MNFSLAKCIEGWKLLGGGACREGATAGGRGFVYKDVNISVSSQQLRSFSTSTTTRNWPCA